MHEAASTAATAAGTSCREAESTGRGNATGWYGHAACGHQHAACRNEYDATGGKQYDSAAVEATELEPTEFDEAAVTGKGFGPEL